eukprot:4569415-Amphidinium_carterae.1
MGFGLGETMSFTKQPFNHTANTKHNSMRWDWSPRMIDTTVLNHGPPWDDNAYSDPFVVSFQGTPCAQLKQVGFEEGP